MNAGLMIGLVLAFLVGVSLGLMGGGGSILTVPFLTYVMGMGAQEAIASSSLSSVSYPLHHFFPCSVRQYSLENRPDFWCSFHGWGLLGWACR